MGSPVVHFEVNGPDHAATAGFYAELFGWATESVPEFGYTTVDTRSGAGINGGFGSPPDAPAFVTFYVAVDDLQEVLDRAASMGGRTVMPVTEIPGVVTMAQLADPAGNVIGLVGSGEGPGVSEGEGVPVDWFEVLGPDGKALEDFYSQLFGWSMQDASGDGFTYSLVDTGARAGINGGVGSSPDGKPKVTIYAHVDDLERYLARVQSLGGTIVLPPMQVQEGLTIAQIRDPQGTTFGLYVGG